jgi:hypothetical protein
LRSEEVRLTEAPQEPPEYILGDSIELSILYYPWCPSLEKGEELARR